MMGNGNMMDDSTTDTSMMAEDNMKRDMMDGSMMTKGNMMAKENIMADAMMSTSKRNMMDAPMMATEDMMTNSMMGDSEMVKTDM
jgi:hypothetical protein